MDHTCSHKTRLGEGGLLGPAVVGNRKREGEWSKGEGGRHRFVFRARAHGARFTRDGGSDRRAAGHRPTQPGSVLPSLPALVTSGFELYPVSHVFLLPDRERGECCRPASGLQRGSQDAGGARATAQAGPPATDEPPDKVSRRLPKGGGASGPGPPQRQDGGRLLFRTAAPSAAAAAHRGTSWRPHPGQRREGANSLREGGRSSAG